MAGLSLMQYATQMMEGTSADQRQALYIASFAREHPLVANLPVVDVPGTAVAWQEETALNGSAYRAINGSVTPGFGRTVQKSVALKVLTAELDVDSALVAMNGEAIRSQQEAMQLKELSHRAGQKIIHGDSDSDANEFDGLQSLLGTTGDQVVDAGATSGGDALSLAILDQAIDAVDNPSHLLMSQAMARLMAQAARKETVSGHLEYLKNDFGYRQMSYNGLPILITDPNNAAYSTLGFTEANPGGGTAASTSIYIIQADPTGVSIAQNGPPVAQDLGQIDSKPAFRTRFQWIHALTKRFSRSACRLRGIRDAAVVA